MTVRPGKRRGEEDRAARVSVSDKDAGHGVAHSFAKRPLSEPEVAGILVWILPAVGGGPIRVGSVLTYTAAWAPDGQHIAYFTQPNLMSERGDLYISNRDGSEPRKVATLPGFPVWFGWSADGRVLRFTLLLTDDPGFRRGALWEVRTDGTHLHPLLPRPHDEDLECCGHWTADGRYYVFRSGDAGGELWARCEKGTLLRRCPSEPMQLTAGPLRFLDVTPSRDGKKLFAIGSDRRVEVVRYDLEAKRFEPYLSGISVEGIGFSRDGQWVAYASTPEETLWKSRLDGSDRVRITPPGMSANNPRWSPDGSQIAFQAQNPGTIQKVYLMSADGGPPRQVANGASGDYEADANWSPDGKSLIFSRVGVGVERVDLSTKQTTLIPGSEQLHSASWSPSGRYLDAITDDWQTIMLFDFTTGKWKKLAQGPADWNNWSHDEKYIYFDDAWFKYPGSINRVRLSDGKVERVVSLEEVGRVGRGKWGVWTGLAPDDSPLTLRDSGIDEIYALDWQEP
jgi:Tol biopolymer transport system component